MKATLANEDHPNHHPPTHPDVLWPHLHTSGLGSPARVFLAGNGASATRDVELSMTCTTLRNKNQGQGCNRGYTASGRRTRTTIKTQPTHPTPTNFNPPPTTLYIYKRRLATSTRRNIMTKASWGHRWGENITYIPPFVPNFPRRRRSDAMSSVHTVRQEE